MRLIDADKLNLLLGISDRDIYAKYMLDKMPTIDAVPVVRCRECNHCDPENYHCDHPMGTTAPLRREPDDFCSYGKRKEGADNGLQILSRR